MEQLPAGGACPLETAVVVGVGGDQHQPIPGDHMIIVLCPVLSRSHKADAHIPLLHQGVDPLGIPPLEDVTAVRILSQKPCHQLRNQVLRGNRGGHWAYIDRKDADFDETGTFTVKDNLLTLTEKGGEVSYFKVQEGSLVMLNNEKQPATGTLADAYVLKQEEVFLD